MNKICGIVAALVLALCLGAPGIARSSSYSSEITDFWWNADESGWGVNITLQNDTAYATFFVYDTAQNPTWYSVALFWQGNYVWSGALYQVRGPWFGGQFNSATVVRRAVGNATFTLSDLGHATLTYTVDGVPVSESVTRTTWKNENVTGTYAGGFSLRAAGCFPPNLNGPKEDVGLISITQTGTNVAITLYNTASGVGCSFNGSYSQYGKLGQVQGNFSCADGTHGTFLVYELAPTINGFTAGVQAQNQYCTQMTGYLGGIMRAQ